MSRGDLSAWASQSDGGEASAGACSAPYVANTDNRGWSLYGAPWLQPMAAGGKWRRPLHAQNMPKPLPWVATGCRKQRMVRRGSTFELVQRGKCAVLLAIVEDLLARTAQLDGWAVLSTRSFYRQKRFRGDPRVRPSAVSTSGSDVPSPGVGSYDALRGPGTCGRRRYKPI